MSGGSYYCFVVLALRLVDGATTAAVVIAMVLVVAVLVRSVGCIVYVA